MVRAGGWGRVGFARTKLKLEHRWVPMPPKASVPAKVSHATRSRSSASSLKTSIRVWSPSKESGASSLAKGGTVRGADSGETSHSEIVWSNEELRVLSDG